MARAASLILNLIILSGCSSTPRVVVGSKNFTEQVLLGEVLAQHIERRLGVTVDRKLNLGGTLLAHEALKSGSIDLYPEYTGTALTAVLKEPVERDADAVFSLVKEGYRQWNLLWLDPLGFDNTFAMVVRTAMARDRSLETISDASRQGLRWRLGVGYEFVQRPDGLDGLIDTYGLRLDGKPLAMDLGLLYPALENRKIEMAAANSTDAQLARREFTVLKDNRNYFPPYQCAVVVRDGALARHEGLRAALAELSGRISDEDIRRMNAAVDLEHRAVADVAEEFLAEQIYSAASK